LGSVSLCGELASSGAQPETKAVEKERPHPVYEFAIEVAPAQLEALRQDSRAYVQARVTVGQRVFEPVGLHLKGKGSFREIDDKPALTLDFAHYQPELRFEGMRQVHLNNSIEDESLVKEWIATDLFQRAGIPVPKVAHAKLLLNGRPRGLYVFKEGFDE